MQNLGDRIPRWFYQVQTNWLALDTYVVVFPELFADKEMSQWKAGKWALDLLRLTQCCRIRHQYEVIEIRKTTAELNITLRDNAQIVEYIKGATCRCIPVPGKCPHKEARREPDGVNCPEVVVSSPVVSEALTQLSRIWQDPHAKSVLISSPPGSGKEVLSCSIPYGNGRREEGIRAISMAIGDQEELQRQLYGYQRPDGSIQDGLIEQASGSALFLDEIHQPESNRDASSRASLLRTLEAGKYFPQSSLKQKEVKKVLFVMATSKTLEELAEYKPVDFWTRMTHALQIPHPLHFVARKRLDRKRMEEVIADFFKFFWWDLCERQYQINPLDDPNELPAHQISEYWQQRSMLEIILPRTENEGKTIPERFAERFLDQLKNSYLSPNQFSVRGLRNMVTRLFSMAWSNVAQGMAPWNKENQKSFEEEVAEVFREIRNVARLA